ncbi:PalH-domain-containing protein [Trichoderma citrinoviride]|uniref:PalH-domain-containing protein n=1 Tax=Trichoderma citrinoviride TaxID=58853 RepID=A0A2T4BF49_9HYPO|nr:PalH-domain-containing protein [Trichoderma citrinoviride]PTB67871.1 PalH-domain-containing protein [Trichoderma citrinoviride]
MSITVMPNLALAATSSLEASMALCTSTWLPANGILSLDGQSDDAILTLDSDALFQAPCPTATIPTVSVAVSDPATTDTGGGSSLNLQDLGDDGDPDDSPHFSDFRDPFYASSFPICYALAATTVTAYMLVIMLFITPRSFFDSGVVYLGRPGGFTNSSSGGVNIGGRPWLQKLAALTVAISLTIATADTFRIAKIQYIWGVQNAKVLQNEVMGSTELKAIRIVSDTFLWLAQAQTLIRLFPRHREKIIIMWAAFFLISLDVIFSALNSFLYSDPDSTGNSMPKSFAHPIPALSYLFQLALGVLYAAWVVYYAIMKKRYSFYHPLMKNMCLVAGISLGAILIPVVFFILDISKPEFTGWGDYVRWVGAAAASVVVWEWVERIEALEREEKKDGILGREVFDGDDTLEVNAAELPWSRKRKGYKPKPGGDGDGRGVMVTERERMPGEGGWPAVSGIGGRHRERDGSSGYGRDNGLSGGTAAERTSGPIMRVAPWITRPPPVATPVSRTDTTSAASSTVYAVRHQGGGSDGMPRAADSVASAPMRTAADGPRPESNQGHRPVAEDAASTNQPPSSVSPGDSPTGHIAIREPPRSADLEANSSSGGGGRWQALLRRGSGGTTSPVQSSPRPLSDTRSTITTRARIDTNRWDIRGRLEEFAMSQAERIRERLRPTTDTENLPVMVIPAPARRGAALQQVLEEEGEELGSAAASALRRARGSSSSSSSEEVYEVRGRNTMAPAVYSRGTTGARERPIPPTNPPLWPGVRNRHLYDDDDYSYDDSVTETSSVLSREHEHEHEHEQEHGNEHEPDPEPEPEIYTGREDRRTMPPGDPGASSS